VNLGKRVYCRSSSRFQILHPLGRTASILLILIDLLALRVVVECVGGPLRTQISPTTTDDDPNHDAHTKGGRTLLLLREARIMTVDAHAVVYASNSAHTLFLRSRNRKAPQRLSNNYQRRSTLVDTDV
jgi:hypothetical protein